MMQTPQTIEEMLDAAKRHVNIMKTFTGMLPKHHMLVHAVRRVPFLGNPALYWNFYDEGLNKVLKQCCRNACQHMFEPLVFEKLRQTLARAKRRR